MLIWYIITLVLGSFIGSNIAGQAIKLFKAWDRWSIINAYHLIFGCYVAMGVLILVASFFLSEHCKFQRAPKDQGSEIETSGGSMDNQPAQEKLKKGVLARILRDTLLIIATLWLLLMIGSLADVSITQPMTGFLSLTLFLHRAVH